MSQATGYVGRLQQKKVGWMLRAYLMLFTLAMLGLVWKGRSIATEPWVVDAAVLGFGYLAVLWMVNYTAYLTHGIPEMALQGRYVFPILVPFCGLLAFGLLGPLRGPFRIVFALAVGAFFAVGELPFFLAQQEPGWFVQ